MSAEHKQARVTDVRPVDDDHRVVTVEGGHGVYRRWPCGGCPWRVDQTGEFPAEAFGQSARTAYDMSTHIFGCHEAGAERPTTCAGFLLRGGHHNMKVRMMIVTGAIDLDAVHDGGHELHRDYWTMAVENGLPESDPRLAQCRHTVDADHLGGAR